MWQRERLSAGVLRPTQRPTAEAATPATPELAHEPYQPLLVAPRRHTLSSMSGPMQAAPTTFTGARCATQQHAPQHITQQVAGQLGRMRVLG